MPPAAKRNSGVILFDINATNKDEALLALIQICTYNWLSNVRDTYRLILTNTEKTRNAKGYEHIYDTDITASCQLVNIVDHIENAKPAEGNWLEPILLAINFLKEEYMKPEVITPKILYITNLEGPQNFDETKINNIARCLNEYNIYLYIIGPNVKLPYTIVAVDDVVDCMKEIEVDENNRSLLAAKRLITAVDNSIMCNLKVGIHLFYSFQNPRGTQPWKVPLDFFKKLEIPANTVRIYKQEAPFKLKKDYNNFSYALAEDESIEVNNEELLTGILRHDKFIRVDSNEVFKTEGPRCFSILGFTDRSNVPESYITGDGSFHVLPAQDKTDDCCQAIYNLVDELFETKKCAIAKRVYNANNKPKYFVLIPQPDLEPKCFVMSELPYADELTYNHTFRDVSNLPRTDEDEDEDDVLKKYVESLDIWNPENKVNVSLSPKMMLNPYTIKLANETVKKQLERDFDFDRIKLGDDLEEHNEFLDAFKTSWTPC